jgi:hypothetical protein
MKRLLISSLFACALAGLWVLDQANGAGVG